MSEHTPTPWKRDKYGHAQDANGEPVILTHFALNAGTRNPAAEEAGKLAFAAVNAFHDETRTIATEDISEGLVWKLHDALKLALRNIGEKDPMYMDTRWHCVPVIRALLQSLNIQEREG